MSSSKDDLANKMKQYQEELNNLKNQNELNATLEQRTVALNTPAEEFDLDDDQKNKALFQIVPVPPKNKPSDEQKKDEKKEEEEEEEEEEALQVICICLIVDKNGKLLAYSIGQGQFSNEFHDVSDLNMSVADFNNQLENSLNSSFRNSPSINDASVREAINAFKNQLPGSKTFEYKNSALENRVNHAAQDKRENIAAERKATDSPTPFNTTPKPW